MKNYTDSDYALNRHSAGIVYRFANKIVEITLKDYLKENPYKTEQDFHTLKVLSDADYYTRDRNENAQTKKNLSIHNMEEYHNPTGVSLADEYIEAQDRMNVVTAYSSLMQSGILTETQKRRLILHVVSGLSLREIAEREEVHFTSVDESIVTALRKLKRFLR